MRHKIIILLGFATLLFGGVGLAQSRIEKTTIRETHSNLSANPGSPQMSPTPESLADLKQVGKNFTDEEDAGRIFDEPMVLTYEIDNSDITHRSFYPQAKTTIGILEVSVRVFPTVQKARSIYELESEIYRLANIVRRTRPDEKIETLAGVGDAAAIATSRSEKRIYVRLKNITLEMSARGGTTSAKELILAAKKITTPS